MSRFGTRFLSRCRFLPRCSVGKSPEQTTDNGPPAPIPTQNQPVPRLLSPCCFIAHWLVPACSRTFPANVRHFRVELRLDVVMETARFWGMHKPMSNDITEHVLQTVELARPIVAAINRRDRDLASQVRRALSSVGLNVAEALGVRSGNSRLRFETALGSLREARAGVRIAVAWGYVPQSAVAPLFESLDSLGGRVFGLGRR